LVERAPHTISALVEHVRIDHRRAHVAIAEQFLDCPDVVPRFEQVGGEGVPHEWHVAGRGMPAARTASFTARWTTNSCR